MPKQIASLTLDDARRAIAAGERQANEFKVPYNIAVVDAGGALVAHVRMDGAWLGSIDIAIDKAWTACAFDMPTDTLSGLAQVGQQGFGLNTTNRCRVVIFGVVFPSWLAARLSGRSGPAGGASSKISRWLERQ